MTGRTLYLIVLTVGTTLPTVLFPVLFMRSRWRTTDVGRDQMQFSIVLAVIFVWVTVSNYFPDFPGREYARFPIMVALAVVLWRRLIRLVKVQRDPYVSRVFTPAERDRDPKEG